MSHHKKFYLILILLIAGVILLLIIKIKEARSIVTNYVETPIVNSTATYIPIFPADPTFGNPGAKLWIVLFADLGCKRCGEITYAITKFIRENPEKARLIWKDTPQMTLLSTGNLPAHLAAYCAYEQGQFFPFVNLVMTDKNNLKESGLNKVAQSLNLDINKWQICRTATTTQNKIAESMALAKSLGVVELPAIFVNNKKINLMDDINIEELLNKFTTVSTQ
ncbi:MAG: thioredoxin domain-containing protein [Candidatus Magasanikbacteria bacterium]